MNRDKILSMGFELVGQCGVNSGHVMIIDPQEFLSKHDYEKINSIRDEQKKSEVEFKNGVICGTWYGDGNYHVYVQRDKDQRVERILVDFTTTFGFDDKNSEMHDIDMKELVSRLLGDKNGF